ncbi:MAG TPA: hypothetical protein VFV99_27150 [Kofleriaceae bacterium]|nr:hypothetical protein [Kofleriaceae bacterium]
MELARGTIAERPWAVTLAMFARRCASGQLTLLAGDKRYSIAYDRGSIVAARSPLIADSAARVALTSHIATPTHIRELERQQALIPGRDDVDLLAAIARLSPGHINRLRADTIIRAAARTFAIDAGEYIFEDTACLPGRGVDVDVRAIIYHGIHMHLSDQRLAADLRRLGGALFVLEDQASDELHKFGFCEGEWPLLAALREGASLPELEARHREIDPRTMYSTVYALVACGTARVVAPSRLGTPPQFLRTKSNPELAAEAAERAERALKNEQLETAVLELKTACELVPNNVDYNALLGWALFCASHDKHSAAVDAKKALERAVHRSDRPQVARFYLGRIERMLGRDKEALRHFQAVLLEEPHNTDASAEVRVLQARMRQRAN